MKERAIEVSNLKKYFKDVKAVDDISFSVEQGELFGFLGVNGAGKSTVINILCTLYKKDGGSVRVLGNEVGKDDEKIRQDIGMVHQENSLDELLTVKENLQIRGGLYGETKENLRKNFDKVVKLLGLKDFLNRPYGKLSGGQKRRAEIAAALMHEPKILFLDEPTTGLDPATRKKVWEAIVSLQKKLGMTVFLTTHYMEEAANAKHVCIIDHGKVLMSGTPFELKNTYVKDILRLYFEPEKKDEVKESAAIKALHLTKETGDMIEAELECTKDALDVLEKIRGEIKGFEVVQGTMDDLFINVTGGNKNA